MNCPQMVARWSPQIAFRHVQTAAVFRAMALVLATVFLYVAMVLLVRDAGQLAVPASTEKLQAQHFQPGDMVRVVAPSAPLKVGAQTLTLVRQGTVMKVIEAVDGWVGGRVATAGKTRVGWISVDEVTLAPPETTPRVPPAAAVAAEKVIMKGNADAAGSGKETRRTPSVGAIATPPVGSNVALRDRPSRSRMQAGNPGAVAPAQAATTLKRAAATTTTNTNPTGAPSQRPTPELEGPSTGQRTVVTGGKKSKAVASASPQDDRRSFGRAIGSARLNVGVNNRPARVGSQPVVAVDKPTSTPPHAKTTAQVLTRNRSARPGPTADIQLLFAHTIDQIENLDHTKSIGQLTLAGDQFDDRVLKDIDGLSIEKLSIETTSLTNNCMKYIAHIRGLRLLRLWSPRFSDGVLHYLCQFKDLEILDLDPSGVVGEQFKQLAGLTKLHMLVLGPMTTDATLEQLAALPALSQLDLRACDRLTEASFTTLAKMTRLKQLWLPASIARKGRSALRKRLPKCRIQ